RAAPRGSVERGRRSAGDLPAAHAKPPGDTDEALSNLGDLQGALAAVVFRRALGGHGDAQGALRSMALRLPGFFSCIPQICMEAAAGVAAQWPRVSGVAARIRIGHS